MRNKLMLWGLALIIICAAAPIGTSCKAKYGCPSNEEVKPNINRKGKIKSGRSHNHELFDKKTRKKMGH